MGYPEHPETIILKNKFYPKGLKEIDVWHYYQKNKSRILREVNGKDLMLAIMVNINEPIMMRKGKSGSTIKLTNSNYDKIITGRTITIYSTMKRYEDFGIIDIDTDNWREAKLATINIYEEILRAPFIFRDTLQIRFTGKTSFHIYCEFKRKTKIDSIRLLFSSYLKSKDLENKYIIGGTRKKGLVNIDLSPNKYRGAYITNRSLSIIGLRCMEVDVGDVLKFDPYKSKI